MNRFRLWLRAHRPDRQLQRTAQVLTHYVGVLIGLVVIYTVAFQVIMRTVEGQEHSWVTGIYWVLMVMSTLGFGDVTFQSDVGRIFTMIVLLSGVVLLLVVLPFVFIRLAPWLETRFRMQAPRRVPATLRDHVVLCRYDAIARGLIERFQQEQIPYVVLEPDPDAAAEGYVRGLSMVQGEIDSKQTYEQVRVGQARLVLATLADTLNTNIALTVREVAPDVPVVAVANYTNSIDVLELSGVTRVLPLKQWLGEQLASRVKATHARSQAIGRFEDLLLAEFPVHHTPLAGHTLRETQLRESTGVSIVGVWEHGQFNTARPDLRLTQTSIPVVIGTEEQLEELNNLLVIYDYNPSPVLVIGGGVVGRAAVQALRRNDVPVHVVDRDPAVCRRLEGQADGVFCGDAADYDLLTEAGVLEAPSVLLTTNDDAINIFLASYCRHLNQELRIVSRVTHQRNVEALHRAGADLVLSYHSLGVEVVMSILKGRELIVLGEGVDLFRVPVPPSLHDVSLGESGIGARTGLIVIALRHADGTTHTSPPPSTTLPPDAELVFIGSTQQREAFAAEFG